MGREISPSIGLRGEGQGFGHVGKLSDEVLELIFSKLPETAVLRASCVCKRWCCLVKAPYFSRMYTTHYKAAAQPSFLFNGVKYLLKGDKGKLAFEIDAEVSKILSCSESLQLPGPFAGEKSLEFLEGAGGFVYSLVGDRSSRVLYKVNLLDLEWKLTPEMVYGRSDSVVGIIMNGDHGAHKLVFAGGIADLQGSNDDRVVEVYDSEKQCWEFGQDIPYVFRGCTSSLFMSSTVHKQKLYIYDNYAGYLTRYDLENKIWTKVKLVRQEIEVVRSFLVSRCHDLLWIGVEQDTHDRHYDVDVWNIDETTGQVVSFIEKTKMTKAHLPCVNGILRYIALGLEFFSQTLGVALILIAQFIILLSYWTHYFLKSVTRGADKWLKAWRSARHVSFPSYDTLRILGNGPGRIA